MRHLMALIAASAVLAGAAHANTPKRDWYVLNFGSGECQEATTMPYHSPAAFHEEARKFGIVDSVRVEKDDSGNIMFVATSMIEPEALGGQHVTLLWFPGKSECQIGKLSAQLTGELPDMSDLK